MHRILGAHLTADGCEFTVWAPDSPSVAVVIESTDISLPLRRDDDGYFSGYFAGVKAGTQYRYQLHDQKLYPDPCSRYQPSGPHGPSMVVDPHRMQWHDSNWSGLTLLGQVLYELHIGTFTTAGTFDAAAEKLEYLQSLGITAVEIMPIAEWSGQRCWGYDGVCLFSPTHNYGNYDALKRFVDRAHTLGIGVILDVVYNHLGPDGNYLSSFSSKYFTDRYKTEWGDALNFDGPGSEQVREFIIQSACEWISAFHLDGLRLDATQSIFDSSASPIIAELVQRTRSAAGMRQIILIAENEPQHSTHLLPPTQGGFGLDAMWNDDFHHSAMVAVTGKRHAYFHDYYGRPQELVSAVKYGFLFQGQYFHWQHQVRGEHFESPPAACITFLQNHDQVANSLLGMRLQQQTSPARYRAIAAVLMLAPQTPMLFMGQEFAASTPFLYFVDHHQELSNAVRDGRHEFMAQFPGAATSEGQQMLADPAVIDTFNRCKLNWTECERNKTALQFHRDLITLRNSYVISDHQQAVKLDGAVLAEHALLLRWLSANGVDRLLIVNLGMEISLQPLPEPLLVCPRNMKWVMHWSSEDVRYGGMGIENPQTDHGWYLPAESAVLLQAVSLTGNA